MERVADKPADEMMTVAEVAEVLHVGLARTYQLVSEGRLPACRLSERRIRIPRRAFDAWLAERADEALENLAGPR